MDTLLAKALAGLALVATLGTVLVKFLFERWLKGIDERFIANDARALAAEEFASESRRISHDEIGRVHTDLGKVFVRQERVEEDIREASGNLKDITREWRVTFEALRDTVATL